MIAVWTRELLVEVESTWLERDFGDKMIGLIYSCKEMVGNVGEECIEHNSQVQACNTVNIC